MRKPAYRLVKVTLEIRLRASTLISASDYS